MAMIELVKPRPDWAQALEVALMRPEGVPERRSGDDPWRPDVDGRPRRVSDDLAWFRDALEEPDGHGLRALPDTAAEGAWEPDGGAEVLERIARLRDRGILEAAGFLVHDDEALDL